eukprot:CAMPEP_0204190920 /NCGR_PEP_ID=MMETSP0361-20130328/59694_1 /ASSEMBLY_ACC=CAM_ASM_000343 /TAXON_ID=268821 /ORGANISM="Scrippsiella Hangoei, Strain SHTV-5" /LENGTH=207 /DNA_ID=CAMNT_0051151815 /DNA_START=29 /DNA_END=650 /DNA_ORIENTATION=+
MACSQSSQGCSASVGPKLFACSGKDAAAGVAPRLLAAPSAETWALAASRAVDWPTQVWRALGEATLGLSSAAAQLAAIRAQQAKGRHVRANRVEAAQDEDLEAERSFLVLQRSLGVQGGEPRKEATEAALAEATAAAAAWCAMRWASAALRCLPTSACGSPHFCCQLRARAWMVGRAEADEGPAATKFFSRIVASVVVQPRFTIEAD